MTKVRVLLAEDHQLVRAGIHALLDKMGGVSVVAEVSDGQAAVKALGLNLSAITPIVRQEFGLDGREKGVLITDVDPDSDAAERGLRPGDRIVAVGGTEVRAVSDVSGAVALAKSQKRPSVLLFVERGQNQRVYVPVKIK